MSSFHEGQKVIFTFKPGIRSGLSKQRIRCVVVDPQPFPDGYNGELRMRVRCTDTNEPMNGSELTPSEKNPRRSTSR